jgi:hypothetical protein
MVFDGIEDEELGSAEVEDLAAELEQFLREHDGKTED